MIQLRHFVLKCSLKRNCEKKTTIQNFLPMYLFMYNYELRIQEHCISTIHEWMSS